MTHINCSCGQKFSNENKEELVIQFNEHVANCKKKPITDNYKEVSKNVFISK